MLMKGTRWPQLMTGWLRHVHRELRITFTPLVRPEKWVFVVGCYNSGTELLMHLLGDHPDIASLPTEGQFLTDQLPADYELGLPRMWTLREDQFRLDEHGTGPDPLRLKREWLMRLDRRRRVFLEKSPPNAARTRWLQEHFEDAYFIAIVRNGYAVAEGIRRKAEPRHLRGGWPIELCARQWSRSYEVLLEDASHLHNVIWVRYEDLAERPQTETTRILRFLGLEGGIELGKSWKIHEQDSTIRNMNAASIDRLTPEEKCLITREAAPMLHHFGYEVLA